MIIARKAFIIVLTVTCFTILAYWSVIDYINALTPDSSFLASEEGSNVFAIAVTTIPEMCKCFSQGNRPATIEGSKSLCQYQTTNRGVRQKVVSYALEGDPQNPEILKKYFHAVNQIARQIKEIYPGWLVRIYHKYERTDVAFTKYLCSFYCHNDHVDLCNVTDLEKTSVNEAARNLSAMYSRMWRFTPIADPTVDVFISRDIDSNVTTRERAAVNEWLIQSNKTLHIMRDNQYHSQTVLAGMWGARMDTGKREALRNWFLKTKQYAVSLRDTFDSDRDQDLLASVLLAVEKYDVVRHESFHCTDYPDVTRPFPTKRIGHEFVGARIHDISSPQPKCSTACRPKVHQEWEYC